MNQNGFRTLRFNFSGLNFWLTLLLFAWLLGSLGLGWLVKSIAILIVFMIAVPIVGIVVLQWWLKRNLVEGQCPVCTYELTGLNGTQMRCPSCGEPLKIHQGHFDRLTPPGTVDVQAIDVSVKQLED